MLVYIKWKESLEPVYCHETDSIGELRRRMMTASAGNCCRSLLAWGGLCVWMLRLKMYHHIKLHKAAVPACIGPVCTWCPHPWLCPPNAHALRTLPTHPLLCRLGFFSFPSHVLKYVAYISPPLESSANRTQAASAQRVAPARCHAAVGSRVGR